jgi:hypothetical protein
MNKHYTVLLFSAALAFLPFSCRKENRNEGKPVIIPEIEIGRAMDSAGKFGISEMTDEISFVALETTDSSLIGSSPYVDAWGDKILVSSISQPLLVFDRNDGHFCNSIGHVDNGPEGCAKHFGLIPFYIDPTNGTVYLIALGGRSLLRYDINGRFLGRVTPDTGHAEGFSLNSYFFLALNDTVTAHHTDNLHVNTVFSKNNPYIFLFNGTDGNLLDTLPFIVSPVPPVSGIISISVFAEGYESFGGTGIIQIEYKDGKAYNEFHGCPSMWTYGGQRYFKEDFIDTVYTVCPGSENLLTPRLALNLGRWQWPYEERLDKKGSESRIFINYMMENENVIYFHFHTGNLQPYCGFYDKRSGTTRVMKGDLIEDDLYNFLPLTIRKVSASGEFLGLIEASDILEWKEQNASVPGIPNIESLLNVDGEDNPVIVFVK